MRTGFLFHSLAIVEQTSKKLLPDLLISGWSVVLFWPALPDEQTKTASTARTDRRRIELSNQGRSRHSGGEFALTFRSFNDLRFHSNANKKVIDTQCTFVLFYRVFANQNLRQMTALAPGFFSSPRFHRSIPSRDKKSVTATPLIPVDYKCPLAQLLSLHILTNAPGVWGSILPFLKFYLNSLPSNPGFSSLFPLFTQKSPQISSFILKGFQTLSFSVSFKSFACLPAVAGHS